MSTNKSWKVKLGLSQKTALGLIGDGRKVITMITGDPNPPGNPNFKAPNPVPADPTLVEFGDAIDELEAAYELPNGVQRTAALKNRRTEVENMYKGVGRYVETVANLPANVAFGDEVILSAGMAVAKNGGGYKVEGLAVKNKNLFPGTVKARDKRFMRGTTYVWKFRKKGEINWATSWMGDAASYEYTGLTSGATYQFQAEHYFKDKSTSLSSIIELPVL